MGTKSGGLLIHVLRRLGKSERNCSFHMGFVQRKKVESAKKKVSLWDVALVGVVKV